MVSASSGVALVKKATERRKGIGIGEAAEITIKIWHGAAALKAASGIWRKYRKQRQWRQLAAKLSGGGMRGMA